MANIVSIQGFEGSFHQIAARQFFGNEIGILPCATFREVIEFTKKGETDASVMAIENSIAGSILANYNLLHKSGLSIVGEVYLPIKQHLLVNPGVKFEDIREVHSHPIAILQCMEFLSGQNWKLVETEDTALSAKHIHQRKSKHIAGVAGKLAAELFGLEIAAENIHTEKNNYTRFLILQKKAVEQADADKASLSFHTDHSRGSLARVLTKIAEGGVNLSKLQSFPIPSNAWKYNFHADLEFDSMEQFQAVLNEMKPVTEAVKVYGIYKNGNANPSK
ncbi:MAG: prephenate dehydratase [Bacteroidota bacterium]|nr:prephenate dehydratase [Bacteroidota bacterium]